MLAVCNSYLDQADYKVLENLGKFSPQQQPVLVRLIILYERNEGEHPSKSLILRRKLEKRCHQPMVQPDRMISEPLGPVVAKRCLLQNM